jgi:hypothetical protein
MQALASPARRDAPGRRPTVLELSAAGLLAMSVILHLVALIPHYYGGPGQGSLWSEPDQAAQYVLLAAGWALALGVALTGPARVRLGAAIAVGVAATEFGFRLSDLGEVFRYGSAAAATGLWLMTAAWAVGAGGAVLAVLAVLAQRRQSSPGAIRAESLAASAVPGEDAWRTPDGEASGAELLSRPPAGTLDAGPAAVGPPSGSGQTDVTRPLRDGAPDPTAPLGPVPPDAAVTSAWMVGDQSDGAAPAGSTGAPIGSAGAGLTVLIALLALATAGAFLPAWDHYTGVATATGREISFNLGNAFSGPWQVVIGTVLTAVALVVIPVVAIRMRSRVTGAALVAGSLIVLASQFTSAVVQVDKPVPPSVAGLSGAQASQLGLQLHMSLTGWFTFDLLAAFALFVAAMVVAHVREVGQDATPLEPWPAPRDAPWTAGLPPS